MLCADRFRCRSTPICKPASERCPKKLSEILNDKRIDAELITRFSRKDFHDQVSSIYGLRLLKNAGVKIKAAIGLHTKLYLFDNNILILGSSNFTDGGFTNNTELNLLIEDEEKILAAASKYYDELSDAIDDCYILSDAQIDEESEFQNSLGLSSRGYNRDFQRSFDFGAKLKSKRKSDLIEEILSVENESYIEESDSWLKFEGLVESRLPKTEKIIRNKVNGIYKTNFPRRPRGIKEGDTIILAALSYNSQDRPMPVIFGYAWTDGYKKDYVHSKEEIEERPILVLRFLKTFTFPYPVCRSYAIETRPGAG